MDSITSHLKRKLKDNPSSGAVLKSVLSRLEDLETSTDDTRWDAIQNDFDTLHAHGIWDKTELEENTRLLSSLRMSSTAHNSDRRPHSSMESSEGPRISIVQPSSVRVPAMLTNAFTPTQASLPLELVDTLNHAYFLHVLAIDPAKVLPPGKSILSMISRPHTQSEQGEHSLPKLQAKVEDIAHRAFWDAVRSLYR
jgi:hypothetical protein